MSGNPTFSENSGDEGAPAPRPGLPAAGEERGGLLRDRRFRTAWAISVFLHALLLVWVSLAPSQPKYRFFGSGTAVSLVGADEIPGGSAQGKSGDRPEDVASSDRRRAPAEGPRKVVAPRGRPATGKNADKKKRVAPKKQRPSQEVRRIPAGKDAKKKVVRRKKKRAREARLRRIRERRERARRWRARFEKRKKSKPRRAGARDKRLAKAAPAGGAPLKGYLGEGGGDGQGGGSRGGGSGGVAQTDMDRYYGVLSERVRNHWTLPLRLADVGRLKAEVTVDVGRAGGYRRLRVARASGNRVYDEASLRAVERAFQSAMPTPPEAIKGNWIPIGFRFCGRELGCP